MIEKYRLESNNFNKWEEPPLSILKMKKEYPEKLISETKLLNLKNLHKLLIFLRNIYPIGYSIEGLRRELGLEILTESNMERIEREGLIEKRDLSDFEEQNLPEGFKEFYPEYIITNKGMEFIRGFEGQKLNKNIEWLTRILVRFGIVTLFFLAVQLIFQILAYIKS